MTSSKANRLWMPFIALIGLLAIPAKAVEFKDGDIIFQRSQSRQAVAIAAATRSEMTHVGLIFIERGQPWVYEAVQPVKKTPLSTWIKRGKNHSYEVCRLKNDKKLDREKLKQETVAFLNRNYDIHFDWSDSTIYCSELVWKAYERSSGIELGKLRQLKDFDLTHSAVQKLMRERYGKRIPLKMRVIAPVDLYRCPLLVSVAKG